MPKITDVYLGQPGEGIVRPDADGKFRPQPPAPDAVAAVQEAIIAALRSSDPGAFIEERHGDLVIDGRFEIERVARSAIAALAPFAPRDVQAWLGNSLD